MKYFTAKQIVTEFTTISLVTELPSDKKYMYDRIGNIEYYGVDSVMSSDGFLSIQPPVIEAKEVTYESIRNIIEGSRLYIDLLAIKNDFGKD